MDKLKSQLRRVYWETTAGCNLRCIHCRRTDVLQKGDPNELTTKQAKSMIDQLAEMGKPVLIFSGGEPLYRRDIFNLLPYAKEKGLPIAVSTNGTLVTPAIAKKLKDSGVYYSSISLDGVSPETHDLFRGKGNYVRAVNGLRHLQDAGIKVQINFTVTKKNVHEVEKMYKLGLDLKAFALYLFLLVPVGCGVEIAESDMLNAQEVDEWLKWVAQKQGGELPIRAICAPHYYRIEDEFFSNGSAQEEQRKGCLAGIHMCFVSHKGEIYPCGYLPESAGNVTETPLQEIWQNSPILNKFRDPSLLEGRCGACSYKTVCGGCRARAFYSYQDSLAQEPFCSYKPALTA